MKKQNLRQKGHEFETLAASFLEQQGLTLLKRNFHCRLGEIDLIFYSPNEQGLIIFVEVRYRKNEDFGGAKMSVNVLKQQKILRCAQLFIKTKPIFFNNPCRFDVIAIKLTEGNPEIEWVKNAFQSV